MAGKHGNRQRIIMKMQNDFPLTKNIVCPGIKSTSRHVHLGSISLCLQNQEDICQQYPLKSLIPLSLLVLPGYDGDFLGDALTTAGTSAALKLLHLNRFYEASGEVLSSPHLS